MPIFQWMLDNKKNVEVRLADFPLEEGNKIKFREYDQYKGQYTGREFTRKVKFLCKVNFTDFNSIDEILKHGHYVMDLE